MLVNAEDEERGPDDRPSPFPQIRPADSPEQANLISPVSDLSYGRSA